MGEQFTDLMKLAIELNEKDYHIFVNFSGHVRLIEVHVHHGGWKAKSNPTVIFEKHYQETEWIEYVIGQCIDWLTEDHAAFRDAQNV